MNCLIERNSAQNGGVGFLDWSSSLTISSSIIRDISSTASGGSFYLDKTSSLNVDFSSISKYFSKSFHFHQTTITKQKQNKKKKISSSSARIGGGVFFLSLSAVLSITNSQFNGQSNFSHFSPLALENPSCFLNFIVFSFSKLGWNWWWSFGWSRSE